LETGSVPSVAASIEADQLQDVRPAKFPQMRRPVRSAARNSKPYKPPLIVRRELGISLLSARAGALFALDRIEMPREKTKEMNRHG
jgi:hypothetical protein